MINLFGCRMLKEVQNVLQKDRDRPRRWFEDDYFDLIVWYRGDGGISGFQLCYDMSGMERALTWQDEYGFSHNRIDSGREDFHTLETPILVADGEFDARAVLEKFIGRCAGLDGEIYNIVTEKIKEYAKLDRGV